MTYLSVFLTQKDRTIIRMFPNVRAFSLLLYGTLLRLVLYDVNKNYHYRDLVLYQTITFLLIRSGCKKIIK